MDESKPLPYLRKLDRLQPEFREAIIICPECVDAGNGFYALCTRHATEDLFDRL